MNHIVKAVFKGAGWAFISNYGWINKYSKHPEKAPLTYKLNKLRKFANVIFKTTNTEVKVFGEENILEDEVSCYFPNHFANMDSMLLITTMKKDVCFIGKKELEKIIYIGKAFKAVEGVFMDRDNLKQSLRVMKDVQQSLTNREKSWVIFPEGTRLKDQNALIGDFHYGSFKAAMKAGVPIVPVAIFGTFRILRTKPDHKKYCVYISYLPAIRPEIYATMNTQEVAELVRKNVQREIMYHLRPLDNKYMSSNNKNFKFNAIY